MSVMLSSRDLIHLRVNPESKTEHKKNHQPSLKSVNPRMLLISQFPVLLNERNEGFSFSGVGFVGVDHGGIRIWDGFGGESLPGGLAGVVESVGPGVGVGPGEGVGAETSFGDSVSKSRQSVHLVFWVTVL